MEIEHVARERLAARRTTQHERELAVRGGLLRQVVVHTQRRLALVIHEVLGHRAARVGRDVLHRRGVGRRRDDDDRVLHRAGLLEPLDDGGDGRRLLTDRDVHADDALALLIDDRVDRDRGLADGAVADDQLALSAADRDHRVDRLDPRLQRLLHRLAHDDSRRRRLDLAAHRRDDVAHAVDRLSQRVDDSSHEGWSDRDLEHAGRSADLVALFELQVIAEHHRADVVFLEVQRERGDVIAGLGSGDVEHLAGHRLLETVDAGDTVLNLEERPDLFDIEFVKVSGFDLPKQDVFDFARSERRVGCHTR